MEAYKFRVQFLEGAKLWKSRFANDKELLKKLSEDIWEFRTLHNKKYYRLFAFWDKTDNTDTIVIATHGLLKKQVRLLPLILTGRERSEKHILIVKNKLILPSIFCQ